MTNKSDIFCDDNERELIKFCDTTLSIGDFYRSICHSTNLSSDEIKSYLETAISSYQKVLTLSSNSKLPKKACAAYDALKACYQFKADNKIIKDGNLESTYQQIWENGSSVAISYFDSGKYKTAINYCKEVAEFFEAQGSAKYQAKFLKVAALIPLYKARGSKQLIAAIVTTDPRLPKPTTSSSHELTLARLINVEESGMDPEHSDSNSESEIVESEVSADSPKNKRSKAMNKPKTVRKHTTHHACKEIMDKHGGKAIGCCCTGHNCKRPNYKVIEEWVDIIREWHKDDPYPPIRPLAKKIDQTIQATEERVRGEVLEAIDVRLKVISVEMSNPINRPEHQIGFQLLKDAFTELKESFNSKKK